MTLGDILNIFQNHLKSDETLSYVNKVVIQDINDSLPLAKDENYAIILTPSFWKVEFETSKQYQESISFDIVLVVKKGTGSITGETIPNIGFLKLLRDVFFSLIRLSELIHNQGVFILYDEFKQPVSLTSRKPERADFFHEISIPYQIRTEYQNLGV